MTKKWFMPFLLSIPLLAQKPDLPNAPVPHDLIKPWALNFVVADRVHSTVMQPNGFSNGIQSELTLSIALDVRFNKNTNRAALALGYTPENNIKSLTFSFTDKLLEFGRRR